MDENKTNINWFPGHMAKTRRMMEENIKLIDVIVELVDARAPISTKNPYLDQLWKRRPRVIAMNKTDLADPSVTAEFKKWYESQGYAVVLLDAVHKKGVDQVAKAAKELVETKRQAQKSKGNRPVRMMITGIPNVGKSTLVNQLAGRGNAAKTGDRPGVTKGKQWIRLENGVQLLDTPGILWPKFDDPSIGMKIAYIGSISENIVEPYTLAMNFLNHIQPRYGALVKARYGLEDDVVEKGGDYMLEAIGKKRGHLKSGGIVDVERTAVMVMDEFRAGKIGKITLETLQEFTEDETQSE